MMIAHCGDVRRVEERYGEDDTHEIDDVDFTRNGDGSLLVYVGHDIDHLLLAVVERVVDHKIQHQQNSAYKSPLGQQVHKPSKLRTTQIQQEQWGITQRSEHTATVGHQSDEEEYGMHLVFALLVHLQQQTNRKHCRTRCADERCQKEAHKHYECIVHGSCLNIASDVDSARYDEERTEQHDEGDVVE